MHVFFLADDIICSKAKDKFNRRAVTITSATLYIRIVIVLENSLGELASALFKLERSFDGLSVHAFVGVALGTRCVVKY